MEIVTFGCRLNAWESEVMRDHARAGGLSDAVIINTCAVTNEAVRQARQTIRRMKRERPDARMIVTGCAAQIDPEQFAKMAEVDQVLGNAEKLRPETFKSTVIAGGDKVSAPMPGKVIDLRVQPGDEVSRDQTLAVMEAMKMEHSLKAPRDGVVKAVGAEVGEQVAEGVMLVELEEI